VPDRAPRSHVLRLLLRPHDLAESRVAAKRLGDGLCRERIELLDPRDRDGVRALAQLVADDVVVDLAGAKDQPLDRVRIGSGVIDDRLESPSDELLQARGRGFSRSSPFGVISTSGRATASSAWRRSRWKYWAAVVQFATRMFSCAPSWRNRSSRALECSGPLPS
jgi:hypothetical protein